MEAALEDGTPFGRYRLLDLLGRGGMGEVWRAYDMVTERIVALKVLPTQYADDATFQERFRREAKSAAALDEPHIVPIYDFGEIDGRLFVTMRLIKGRDLHGILSDGPMDAARAVGIIDQIASALHAAHQVNLVHRDVKPSNILVADNDFAYLIDFGIARAADQTGLTSTSTVIGTWAYMAPERVTTGRSDPRADIYALACVLYECLTGRQPFGSEGMEQQIGGHLALPPPRATDQRADVPVALDAVIAKGMAKNPDDRFATTQELARAGRAALTEPVTVPKAAPPTVAAAYPPPHPGAAQGPVPSPGDPTRHRSMPYLAPPSDAAPPGPKPPRRGRLIAFSSGAAVVVVVAVVAVVAAIAVSGPSERGASPAVPTTSGPPTPPPNTGPFTGTFDADFGPRTGLHGSPATDPIDAAAFSETWRLRSACAANGCVASASTGGRFPPVKDVVFDNVGGRWLAVSTSRLQCRNRTDDEAWNVVSLQPQADGTMSGEATQVSVNGCASKRTVVVTRAAATDVAGLPDPATLPRRVMSPAEGVHGRYDAQATNAGTTPGEILHYAAQTNCLRTGDRCMTLFLDPQIETGDQYVFTNGAWTKSVEQPMPCPLGGTDNVTVSATMPLPQPPQNPIPTLTAHGYADPTTHTTKCHKDAFEETFTRTGD